MEFKNKQFDGPYEVAEIQINNKGEIFRGMLYFPPESFKKPYPLIIYFHKFPQLFTLTEIVKGFKYLLDIGYAFIAFNFRGYNISEGKISIKNHISDALKMIEFVEKMAKKNIFTLNDINVIAHDFGAYIGLILCSKTKIINKLLLVSPILNLKKHVYNEKFLKVLHYINRFLPGNVQGIEDIDEFIKRTKKELFEKDFQIEKVIRRLKNKKLKIVIGELDKVTPIFEVKEIIQKANVSPEIVIIEGMDHDCVDDGEIEEINQESKKFFENQ